METLNIIIPIVTLFVGGSGVWIFTIKHTRQQAQADAMQHFQTVYQGLINDLRDDRDQLRKDRDELAGEIEDMKKRIQGLETSVEQNAKVIKKLAGYACAKAPSCADCIMIEISQI